MAKKGNNMSANADQTKTSGKQLHQQWWFWLLIVFVVVAIGIGASGDRPEYQGTTNQYNTPSEYHINEKIAAGKSEIEVTGVEYGYTGNSEYFSPDSGHEWVKVNISQTNNSNNKISFNALYWEIQDSDGVIQSYLNANLGAQGDDFFGSGELATGGTKTGSITFEVSAGDRNLTLIYSPVGERIGDIKIKL